MKGLRGQMDEIERDMSQKGERRRHTRVNDAGIQRHGQVRVLYNKSTQLFKYGAK